MYFNITVMSTVVEPEQLIGNNLYIAQQHTKSVSYLGATTWNKIRVSIYLDTNLSGFKRMYIQNYVNVIP